MTVRPLPSRDESTVEDCGSILVLTLILTVVMSVIVLAIASFAITGLRASEVTTARTESNGVASSGLTWFIEELAAKRISPEDPAFCGTSGTTWTTVPAGSLSNPGGNVDVNCTKVDNIDGHPTVKLEAVGTTPDGMTRNIDAVLVVPRASYTTQIRSWTGD